MKRAFTVRWSACTVLSAGLLVGCALEGTSSDVAVEDASIAAAPLLERGHSVDGLTVRAGQVDGKAVQAYEAMKRAKPDDGSVAGAILQPGAEPGEELKIDVDRADEVSAGWKLSLAADRTSFLLGEPVTLRITMENISGAPMKVVPLLQPEFQHTVFSVMTPKGIEVGFQPVSRYCMLPLLATKTLQPGEKVSEEVKLFAARGGWLPTEPGEYTIRAGYNGVYDESLYMLSNSLRIQVVPGNADEQAAAKRIMEGEAGLLLQWERGDHLKSGLEALDEVATRHPNTVHALYAHYALGMNDAQPFFDGKRERAARPAEAAAHLERVRSALRAGSSPVLSASMRANTFRQLASSYQALGRVSEARAVLNELITTWRDDASMADAVRQAREQLNSL